MSDSMLLGFFEWMIPLYGDWKIHRDLSERRTVVKEEIRRLKLTEGQWDEREQQFRKELSDLLEKYNIAEEIGCSYPPRYVAEERYQISNLYSCTSSTGISEITMYMAKYTTLTALVYALSKSI